MSDKEKTNKSSSKPLTFVEDKGLSPASSGTPMPKVKPAKPSGTTSKTGNSAGDKKS